MKAVKRINNNFVLCLSKDGEEFVARGKGIGFHELPYELSLRSVERTYYNVDPMNYPIIDSIPEDILEIATALVDRAAEVIGDPFGANVIFTLADHLHFAVQRHKKKLHIKLPIAYDVEHLFEREYEVGQYGVKLIGRSMGVWLPDEEAAYIALHLINAESRTDPVEIADEKLIEEITGIIEQEYRLTVDTTDFNYARFVTHMHYLLKRGREKKLLQSDNEELFEETKNSFPKAFRASQRIRELIKEKRKIELSNEEQLYLMMHVNRLCTREECDRR